MTDRATFNLRRIIYGIFLLILLGLIVWANIARLQNNVYSNYERAVDYGRVREGKQDIRPALAAIFYADKEDTTAPISTYFDHSDNYKKHNIKIVVVPKNLTSDALDVVEKLYAEIRQNNVFEQIAIVYDGTGDIAPYKVMLREAMRAKKMTEFTLAADNLAAEPLIEAYLQQPQSLVVILADLSKGIGLADSDFLTAETIYWAQKYAYHLNVFDMIDTRIARAMEKDYASLFVTANNHDEPKLLRQKHNLEQYVERYGAMLWFYFKQNAEAVRQKQPVIQPQKNDESYRLFDRGTTYVEAENFAKQQENKGVVVSFMRLARRMSEKGVDYRQARLFLLTDKQPLVNNGDAALAKALDIDDGIMVLYRGYKALMLPHERPENMADLPKLLRKKAGIPVKVNLSKIRYYKFKMVEISDEN